MTIKTQIQFSTIAAVVIALAQTVQADLITGNIGFGGAITLDTDSAGTATAVTAWDSPMVILTTGTFAAPSPFAVADHAPVTFAPGNWNFTTTSPITNFWNVGGFKFELLSSYISFQGDFSSGGFLVVHGAGVVSGNGYTPTSFTWSFSMLDPSIGDDPPEWTFSISFSSNNTNGAPVLVSERIGSTTVLSWNDPTFGLQVAPAVSGIFTDIPGATSPYTNTLTDSQQFFRLQQ